MRYTKLIPLLALTLLVGAASGCVVHGRTRAYGTVGYSVHTAPPAPRYVYVDPRPGWLWIDGYWAWDGYQYVWMDGYWERERPGYYYVQGSWHTHSGRHTWNPGYWKRGNGGRGYTYQTNNGVRVRQHGPTHNSNGSWQPARRENKRSVWQPQKNKSKPTKVWKKNDGKKIKVREH
jgi:hypothetical protein